MRSQKAFTTIELLILVVTLLIFGTGSVVVWQNQSKVATPSPSPTVSPTQKNTKVTSAPTQVTPIECQADSDCPPSLGVCTEENCPRWECIGGRCQVRNVSEEYYETPVPTQAQKQNNADQVAECEKRVRKRICEENNIPLDEYDNCVGIDFVDPEAVFQECYSNEDQQQESKTISPTPTPTTLPSPSPTDSETLSCQTAADCPPHSSCIPGSEPCPSHKCVDNRCVLTFP